MKISSIQFTELPSGEAVLRCPQCGTTWNSKGSSELTACKCIRFLWTSSELGDDTPRFRPDFDCTELENAYRQQHWLAYHDDEVIDGDLGSPDPYVLAQLTVPGVDEAVFYPEIPGPGSLYPNSLCVGLRHLRRKTRRGKTPLTSRIDTGVCVPPSSLAKAPAWASSFLGRRFAVESAGFTGWVDQNSNYAQAGVPAGQGIWLFKLGEAESSFHPAGPRIWWRFLLVKLSGEGRISRIYTRVDEVFPDGHGEFRTNDLHPHDIKEALEALEAVAPELAPAVTIN